MGGVRRRLRDVGKTVSGVLGGLLGETQDQPAGDLQTDPALHDQEAPAPAHEEPTVTDTATVTETAIDTGPEPDPVLAAAVDVARAAAREVGGDVVGEHLGAHADGPGDHGLDDDGLDAGATAGPGTAGAVVTHSFATTDRAYVGWRWAVTVARADGSEHVTVDEVVLLPGSGALLAPAWLPWSERVLSGDLAAGDLLPPAADDERLIAAYADPEAEDGPAGAALADAVRTELGLGRARVLSIEGRLDTAERWWDGEAGPDSPIARQAPGQCVDCGFLVLLAGGLRQAFGVCANAVAPDDGRVVALSHGCGAHSETVVDPQHAATVGMAVEDEEFELVPTNAVADADTS